MPLHHHARQRAECPEWLVHGQQVRRTSRSVPLPDYRATPVFRPIGEAEVVDTHIITAGPNGSDSGQRGAASAVAMGHDMVSGLETGISQQAAQVAGGL